MLDEIKKYFSTIYFADIGEKVVPVLYSALLLRALMKKFTNIEAETKFRFRFNVLLYWEAGWFKTSILTHIRDLTEHELKINTLSQASSAALRGSFHYEEFCPPEFLISDVIYVLELAPLLSGDQDNLPLLLTAIEEGQIRVSLIKIPDSRDALAEVQQYGAEIVDRRLCYQNKATMIAATHSLDVIDMKNREAFLSRFFVCYIPPEKINREKIFEDYQRKRDVQFETRARIWFSQCIQMAQKPNFAQIYEILQRGFPRRLITTPREMSNVVRLMIADLIFYPNSIDVERIRRIVSYLNGNGQYKMTTREIIAEAIYDNPMTLPELEALTGTTKANIKGHLNRLKAQEMQEIYRDNRGRTRTKVKYVIKGTREEEQ